MTTGLVSEVYSSGVEIIIETIGHGVINVSDDVESVTVTRRLDGISTATFTLVNYATYSSGRYNGVIHIGDRMHIDFIKDTQHIEAFTGRVFKVPVATFQESTYTVECQDVVGDLKWIYWDPYSMKAQDRYLLKMDFIQQYTTAYAGNHNVGDDGGAGVLLYDFLTADEGVCHLPKDGVRVSAFPPVQGTVAEIVRKTMRGNVDTDAMVESIYTILFGGSSMYVDQSDIDNALSDITGEASESDIANATGTPAQLASITHQLLGRPADTSNNDKISGNMKTRNNSTSGWVRWSQNDGNNHTGLYGLTKQQMSQHAGMDQEAYRCNQMLQVTAITSIYKSMSSSAAAAKNVYYYFTGEHLYDYDSPKQDKYFSENKLGRFITGIELGGKKYTSRKEFYKKVAELLGVGTLKESDGKSEDLNKGKVPDPSSKSGTLNKGKVPAPASTAKEKGENGSKITNQLAQKFQSWVDATRGHYVDPDGSFGPQCWDLWMYYYQNFLGLDMNQWVRQPEPGGNPGFINSFPQSQYYADNFQKLGQNDTLQAGDVGFWAGYGHDTAYGHVSIIVKDNGSTIETFSQNPNAPDYITEQRGALVGALRPKALGGQPGVWSGTGGSSGSAGSGQSAGGYNGTGMSEAEWWAKNQTLKLFKYVMNFSPQQTLNSEMLGPSDGTDTGLALINDKPALEFVSACCKASMRSYMSMPDGTFVAFVPDWFGIINKEVALNATLEIPRQEIISLHTDFDKSSYVSHYMLTTNENFPDPTGMLGANPLEQTVRQLISSGLVTFQYQGSNLLSLMDISCTGCKTLDEVMQRWGVSVRTENNEYIIDYELTSVYALYQFLKYWANCFKTSVRITFRPEIVPGLRLLFRDADQTVFVEQVTHSWNSQTGGSTSVVTTSPMTWSDGKYGVAGS